MRRMLSKIEGKKHNELTLLTILSQKIKCFKN